MFTSQTPATVPTFSEQDSLSVGFRLETVSKIGLLDTLLEVPLSYVIIFDKTEPARILMREGRSGKLGLPGGKRHASEDALDAARREAREETGISFKNKKLHLLVESNMPGFNSMWPIKTAKDHGYSVKGKLKDKNTGVIATVHSEQAFFVAGIEPERAPKKFDGRRYEWVSVVQSSPHSIVQARIMPILELWSEVITSKKVAPYFEST